MRHPGPPAYEGMDLMKLLKTKANLIYCIQYQAIVVFHLK